MILVSAIALMLAAGGQDAPAAPKEKKVCKTIKVTGTRVASRRVCQTQDELRRQNSTDELERQRDMHAQDLGARTRP